MKNRIDQKTIPVRTLYSGEKIPCVGLGTFGSDKYDADTVSEAVYGAVKYGYRLIDCAAVYQNEDRIGMVLHRLFEEKEVERKDLFITSKVWNDMHGDGEVIESCRNSLKDLGLDYLDLYFVHWPFPNYHAPGCSGDSRNPDSRPERDRTAEDVADTELPAVAAAARAHQVHPALICLKWAMQRGQIPIPFSVKEPQYISNLRCVTEDPLTEEEMEAIRLEDKNCRLVKGQVFLWEGAKNWEALWDMDGVIVTK